MTKVTAVKPESDVIDAYDVAEESHIKAEEQKEIVSPSECQIKERAREKGLEASNYAEDEQNKDGVESIEDMVNAKTSDDKSEASSQYSSESGN